MEESEECEFGKKGTPWSLSSVSLKSLFEVTNAGIQGEVDSQASPRRAPRRANSTALVPELQLSSDVHFLTSTQCPGWPCETESGSAGTDTVQLLKACQRLHAKLENLEQVLKHMREVTERRQQLEQDHEQALAILTFKQDEVKRLQRAQFAAKKEQEGVVQMLEATVLELEEKCRSQTRQFALLSHELERFRLQAGDGPEAELRPLTNGVAEPEFTPHAPRPARSPWQPAQRRRVLPSIGLKRGPAAAGQASFRLRPPMPGPLPHHAHKSPPSYEAPPARRSGSAAGEPKVFVVRHSYDPYDGPNRSPEVELPLTAGEYICIYGDMDEDGFYEGELLDGRRGLVPCNFVEPVSPDDTRGLPQPHGHLQPCSETPEGSGPPLAPRPEGGVPGGDQAPLTNGFHHAEAEDQDEDPVPPPRRLTLIRRLARSVVVGWDPPAGRGGHVVRSYDVYVDEEPRLSVPSGSPTTAVLERVDADLGPYRVTVRSVTDRGRSDGPRCTLLLGRGARAAPQGLRAERVTPTSARLVWLPSDSGYMHSVSLDDGECWLVKPGGYSLSLSGLSPGRRYRATVEARSPAPPPELRPPYGREHRTATVTFITPTSGRPAPPRAPQLQAGPGPGIALVSWQPVGVDAAGVSDGATVTGYAVYADGAKVLEVSSATAGSALMGPAQIRTLRAARELTVRTMSPQGESADSAPVPVPPNLALGGALAPPAAGPPLDLSAAQTPTVLHEPPADTKAPLQAASTGANEAASTDRATALETEAWETDSDEEILARILRAQVPVSKELFSIPEVTEEEDDCQETEERDLWKSSQISQKHQTSEQGAVHMAPSTTTPNRPQPNSITQNRPESSSTNPNRPQPNSITPNRPQPNSITQNRPESSSTNPNRPQPNSITQNRPKPSTTTPNRPQPNSITQNRPESSSTNPNRPKPSSTTPNRPQPNSITPNRPEPNSITPNRPEPNSITPNRPQPNSITPNRPEPNSTNPNRLQPNSINPDRPESWSTTPNRPEPSSITPNISAHCSTMNNCAHQCTDPIYRLPIPDGTADCSKMASSIADQSKPSDGPAYRSEILDSAAYCSTMANSHTHQSKSLDVHVYHSTTQDDLTYHVTHPSNISFGSSYSIIPDCSTQHSAPMTHGRNVCAPASDGKFGIKPKCSEDGNPHPHVSKGPDRGSPCQAHDLSAYMTVPRPKNKSRHRVHYSDTVDTITYHREEYDSDSSVFVSSKEARRQRQGRSHKPPHQRGRPERGGDRLRREALLRSQRASANLATARYLGGETVVRTRTPVTSGVEIDVDYGTEDDDEGPPCDPAGVVLEQMCSEWWLDSGSPSVFDALWPKRQPSPRDLPFKTEVADLLPGVSSRGTEPGAAGRCHTRVGDLPVCRQDYLAPSPRAKLHRKARNYSTDRESTMEELRPRGPRPITAQGPLKDGLRLASPEREEEEEQEGPGSEEGERIFVALFSYDPAVMSPNPETAQDELPFQEGQIIKVYGDKDEDGFYSGESAGRCGYVPGNMVSELHVEDQEARAELLQKGFLLPEPSVANKDPRPPGQQPQKRPSRRMVALFDYDPRRSSPNADVEEELSFAAGDVIEVFGDMDEDGFFYGELNGHQGLVPSNFLQAALSPGAQGPEETDRPQLRH